MSVINNNPTINCSRLLIDTVIGIVGVVPDVRSGDPERILVSQPPCVPAGLSHPVGDTTGAQLGALSTLIILVMSSIGGSMFPRFLMPEGMQKAGLFTINAWAIDGFTKVFWRDEGIWQLWPQLLVLLGMAVVFFTVARRIARRWEFA